MMPLLIASDRGRIPSDVQQAPKLDLPGAASR
jgi:hypothetical protein